MLKPGDAAPDFSVPAGDGTELRLRDLRGRQVVLYFYPKDNTPGCTQEACEFRDLWPEFQRRGAVLLGVSPDSAASHARFKVQHGLPFTLLSDEGKKIVRSYGVWKRKTRYGRRYLGVERTTFLIDEAGRIAAVWNRVKVKGHAAQVLASLPAP